jgi:hypothetical protein
VDAVAVDAGLDAVVDDRAERRPDARVARTRRHPAVGGHLHGRADFLETVQHVGRHERDVVDHPTQVPDAELRVDGLVGVDDLRSFSLISRHRPLVREPCSVISSLWRGSVGSLYSLCNSIVRVMKATTGCLGRGVANVL